jgi:hypothetical protein
MKKLSRRVRKMKGRSRPGYVRYKKVSTMLDNKAHAGKWKRLRHANGTLEKRMVSQKIYGTTRRMGRKGRLVVVDGDAVAVAVVGGVKVRPTILQQAKTCGLRRPLERRQMGKNGAQSTLNGIKIRHNPTGQIDLLGINLVFRTSCNTYHEHA